MGHAERQVSGGGQRQPRLLAGLWVAQHRRHPAAGDGHIQPAPCATTTLLHMPPCTLPVLPSQGPPRLPGSPLQRYGLPTFSWLLSTMRHEFSISFFRAPMVAWSSSDSFRAACTLAAPVTISAFSSRHFLISRFSLS